MTSCVGRSSDASVVRGPDYDAPMRVALVAGLLGLLVGAAGGYLAHGEQPPTTVTKVKTVAPPYAGADFDDDGFGP